MINTSNELYLHLEALHTTPLGMERLKRNLALTVSDPIAWCQQMIQDPQSQIIRRGKNWYVTKDDYELTINAYSYTVITGHKKS